MVMGSPQSPRCFSRICESSSPTDGEDWQQPVTDEQVKLEGDPNDAES